MSGVGVDEALKNNKLTKSGSSVTHVPSHHTSRDRDKIQQIMRGYLEKTLEI